MKKLLPFLVFPLALLSGCATFVNRSLQGQLPIADAKQLKVVVNVAAVGGGSIEVKDVTTDPATGAVTAGEFHEVITTGGGSVTIDGVEVKLRKP